MHDQNPRGQSSGDWGLSQSTTAHSTQVTFFKASRHKAVLSATVCPPLERLAESGAWPVGVGWTVGGVSTTSVGGYFVPFLFGLLGRLGAFID